jgi:hypothetical protein
MDTWKKGLTSCFALAVELGLDIFITPHVNDGGPAGLWRNAVRLNPIAQHGAWSYLGMHVRPIAEALNKVRQRRGVWGGGERCDSGGAGQRSARRRLPWRGTRRWLPAPLDGRCPGCGAGA